MTEYDADKIAHILEDIGNKGARHTVAGIVDLLNYAFEEVQWEVSDSPEWGFHVQVYETHI